EKGGGNEMLEQAKANGLEGRGIPMSGPLDVRALIALSRLIREEGVDLLCAHGYKSTVMGWLAAKRAGIPVISFSRGYTAEDRMVAFYEWVERRVLGRVDGVVAVSDGQRKKLEGMGVKARRYWTVHNAVSINSRAVGSEEKIRKEVFARLGVPEGSIMVVSAGRLSPEKGHKDLVEAISMLNGSAGRAVFVFCGDGALRKELEAHAARLSVDKQCRFVGFRKDINDIFKAMDLLVLPSLTEGLPNVVLEAFSNAKPVVATSVGGVPELVEDGVSGILVPKERPDLLAGAISKCLSSADMRMAMGLAGYRKVSSEFTFEQQTRRLEGIYGEVLGLN
ncbi:MAG: glycosyltransferase family 4 protein, partial [Deltaproteobacteria bacterium]